ncbi:MAG: hypothetical protein WDO18_17710 [Acidobacteriota bacterium]
MKKWLILRSVFDDAIGDTRHLGRYRGQRLTLPIGIERIRAEIAPILYAKHEDALHNGTSHHTLPNQAPKVITYFRAEELAKVEDILKELKLSTCEDVIPIDARQEISSKHAV